MSNDRRQVALDDVAGLRRAMNLFPTGVAAVCGLVDGQPRGMLVAHYASLSMYPQLVMICIATTLTTWPELSNSPDVGISVLGETADPAPLYVKDIDRFETRDWEATSDGAVFLEGSALWLDCPVASQTPMGTHDLVVLSINQAKDDQSVFPLVWQGGGFRKLVPGPVARKLEVEENFDRLIAHMQATASESQPTS